MGKKLVFATIGLSGLTVLVNIISVCLPFHKVEFFLMGALPAFRLVTYTLRVYIDLPSSTFCKAAALASQEPDFCDEFQGSQDIEDMAGRFCAPVVSQTFPNACLGMKYAQWIGLVLVLAVVTNTILNVIACVLVYHYQASSPKKKYRQVALGLHIAGVLAVQVGLIAYCPSAIIHLDHIEPRVNLALVSASNMSGVSKGYLLMWVGVILELVVIVLSNIMKSSDEDLYAEAREHHRFMMEMEMCNLSVQPPSQSNVQMPALGQQVGPLSGMSNTGPGISCGQVPASNQIGHFGGDFRSNLQWTGQNTRVNPPPVGWGAAWGMPALQQPQLQPIVTVTTHSLHPMSGPMSGRTEPPYF